MFKIIFGEEANVIYLENFKWAYHTTLITIVSFHTFKKLPTISKGMCVVTSTSGGVVFGCVPMYYYACSPLRLMDNDIDITTRSFLLNKIRLMWSQTSTTWAWLTIRFSNLGMHNVDSITQFLKDPHISKWALSMREWHISLIPLSPFFLDVTFAEHVGFLWT